MWNTKKMVFDTVDTHEKVKKPFITFPCWHNQKVASVKWKGLDKSVPLRYENENVALLCGDKTGYTVVDIDAYKFTKDSQFIKEFGDNFVQSLNTLTIKTPSGGYHLYFKYCSNLRTSASSKHHIDIRNDGSYIMLPPSSINGKAYEVCNQQTVKRMPIELLRFCQDVLQHVEDTPKEISKDKTPTEKPQQSNIKFAITSEDWLKILQKKESWSHDTEKWIKVTIASKHIGFMDAWDKWSQKGSKYDMKNNMEIWQSLKCQNEEASVNTIHEIMCPVMPPTIDIDISPADDSEDEDDIQFMKTVKSLNKRINRIRNHILKTDNYYMKSHYRQVQECTKGDEIINKPKLDDIKGTERFFKSNVNYLIKSDTATGKTTAFRRMIKDAKVPFISIVSRVMLGQDQYIDLQADDIDVRFYQDRNFKFGDSLIITPESIPLIGNYDISNYVIFLDEFNSIIEHILQSSTMKHNRIMALRILLSMLKGCKNFIAVDADISMLALEFLKMADVKYTFIENEFKHYQDTQAIHYVNEYDFMKEIEGQSKYLVCCDSKSMAEIIKKRLTKAGHSDIILITSDTDVPEGFKLDSYNRVIYSPKIIYGLDSTLSRPVYCYHKGHTITPPQMVQQIARCRNIKYLSYYFKDSATVSTHENYTSKECVEVEINDNITQCLKMFKEMFDRKKEWMIKAGIVKSVDDVIDNHRQAISITNETIYDVYMPIQQMYKFKIDSYRTNMFLQFQSIIQERGFKITKHEGKKQEIPDQRGCVKEINQEKLDNFDVDNKVIQRRMQCLMITKEDIEGDEPTHGVEVEELKKFIIDSHSLSHHFNFCSFRYKTQDNLLNELHKQDDFIDQKTHTDKMTMVVLKKMLDILHLTPVNINYVRKGEVKAEYKEIEEMYNKTTMTSRLKKIETDVDVHKCIIEKYRDLFGFGGISRQKKFHPGEVRQVTVDMSKYMKFHDSIRSFRTM